MNSVKTATLKELREAINNELAAICNEENAYLHEIGSELAPVATAMQNFLLDSGKRLRPIFAYIGFLATGSEPTKEILRACATLELVHVCALMHDDVMDGSDTRRGAPSVHRAFEKMHISQSLQGSAEQFGISAAILIGDLALVWSAKALHQSGIATSDLIRAQAMYDEMRVELMGRHLEVRSQKTIMKFSQSLVYPLVKPFNCVMMCLESLVTRRKPESRQVMISVKVNAPF